MKLKHHVLAGSAVLSLLALSSCIKDEYDLSDIDTTVRLQTKELTVPINLDALTLDQVMDLGEDSEIRDTVVNGVRMYAVRKDGTFKSDPIEVAAFTIDKPIISPTSNSLAFSGSTPPPIPGALSLGTYIIIDVPQTAFNTSASGIDKAIKGIDSLDVSSTFTIGMKVTQTGGIISDWSLSKLEDLQIKLPKGLIATTSLGTFEPATPTNHPGYSLLNLTGVAIPLVNDGTGGAYVNINLDVTAIDKANSAILFDPDNQSLTLNDHVEIAAGRVHVYGSLTDIVPTSVTFTLAPVANPITVNTFTGTIEYDVTSFDIDPIDLSNLPDFLNQKGTVLGLEDPRIYLALNNPAGNYKNEATGVGTYLQTGFKMTPERDGVKAAACELDNNSTYGGKVLRILGGTMAKQNFVMSPASTEAMGDFTNPTHVPFADLKKVLNETDGIPTKIYVDAVSPQVPSQRISKFALGSQLPAVEGEYLFFAPLQLTSNSVIAYADTIDGWNDEDVDAIHISKMRVTFDLTTEVPFPIDLDIIPITTGGKAIAGVTPGRVLVPYPANDFKVDTTIEGEITHLDGIIVKARVHDPDDQTSLDPTMKLHLKNSKVTLTGYYEKEL